MAAPELQDRAVEAVVIMNTAITNLRIYPPTNAMIMKTIDNLYDTLQVVFQEEEELLLSESGKNLLVFGEPLIQRNREKPQVGIFLKLMMNWGIMSIGFNKDLDKSEITLFVELMGKKPDDDRERVWKQLVDDKEMPHIRINQRVYVEMGKDREIVAELDLTDEDIIRYITAENPDAVPDPEQVKQMAKDPEWVSRIFKSGMRHIVDEDAPPSDDALSESMIRMLRSFDKISNRNEKEQMAQIAAKSIADMGPDFIATILTKNIEDLLENCLFEQIIDLIDRKKFEHIVMSLHQITNGEDKNGKGPDGQKIKATREAYWHLMNTDKGVELQHQIEEQQAREREEKEKRIRDIKEKVYKLMIRLDEGIYAEGTGESVAGMLEALYSDDEGETAAITIRQLIDKLKSSQEATRTAASKCLVNVLEHSSDERREEIVNGNIDPLLEWIQSETRATSAFAVICMILKNMEERLIQNGQLEDSLPVMTAFYYATVRSADSKDSGIISAASAVLRELATDEILDILMGGLLSDDTSRRDLAARHLVMMGDRSLKRLLDLLFESESSTIRVFILNLIPEMGAITVPAIVSRIDESAPWYYLRNLARLLGKTGSENEAKILEPLLVHEDVRVQREALKSVNAIGGEFKGEILLNALSGCDDHLKASIATTLGFLKYADAVQPLKDLFRSKISMPEEVKTDLQEKICIALGAIGDKAALQFLQAVSKQSGLFGFKSYSTKVKAAAARAADSLSRL